MLVEKGLEQRFRAFFKFFDDFGHGAAATVKFAIGTGKGLDPFFRKTFRMQAQGMQIQGAIADRVTRCLGAWGNITVHFMGATHKSVGAHLIALLNGSHAANGCILADAYMTAQLAAIRDNNPSTNIAVMGNMGIGHHQHFVCNTGATAPLNSPPI